MTENPEKSLFFEFTRWLAAARPDIARQLDACANATHHTDIENFLWENRWFGSEQQPVENGLKMSALVTNIVAEQAEPENEDKPTHVHRLNRRNALKAGVVAMAGTAATASGLLLKETFKPRQTLKNVNTTYDPATTLEEYTHEINRLITIINSIDQIQIHNQTPHPITSDKPIQYCFQGVSPDMMEALLAYKNAARKELENMRTAADASYQTQCADTLSHLPAFAAGSGTLATLFIGWLRQKQDQAAAHRHDDKILKDAQAEHLDAFAKDLGKALQEFRTTHNHDAKITDIFAKQRKNQHHDFKAWCQLTERLGYQLQSREPNTLSTRFFRAVLDSARKYRKSVAPSESHHKDFQTQQALVEKDPVFQLLQTCKSVLCSHPFSQPKNHYEADEEYAARILKKAMKIGITFKDGDWHIPDTIDAKEKYEAQDVMYSLKYIHGKIKETTELKIHVLKTALSPFTTEMRAATIIDDTKAHIKKAKKFLASLHPKNSTNAGKLAAAVTFTAPQALEHTLIQPNTLSIQMAEREYEDKYGTKPQLHEIVLEYIRMNKLGNAMENFLTAHATSCCVRKKYSSDNNGAPIYVSADYDFPPLGGEITDHMHKCCTYNGGTRDLSYAEACGNIMDILGRKAFITATGASTALCVGRIFPKPIAENDSSNKESTHEKHISQLCSELLERRDIIFGRLEQDYAHACQARQHYGKA